MTNTISEVRQTNSKEMLKGFYKKINDSKTNMILRNKSVKKNMTDLQIKLDKQVSNFKNRNRWIKCNCSSNNNNKNINNSKYNRCKNKVRGLLKRWKRKDTVVPGVINNKLSIRVQQLTMKVILCKIGIERLKSQLKRKSLLIGRKMMIVKMMKIRE